MNWFLIKNNEHLGPFDEVQIKELFKKGEITGTDMLWQHGWPDAKSYEEVFLHKIRIAPKEEISTELPPIPKVEDIASDESADDIEPVILKKKEAKQVYSTIGDSSAKPKANKNTEEKDSQDSDGSIAKAIEDLNLATPTEVIAEKKGRFGLVKNILLTFLILLSSVVGYLYYDLYFTNFSRPKMMSVYDFKRLKRTALDRGQRERFAMALGKDKKTIWVATNHKLQGDLVITMKSMKDKALGDSVEVKAEGKLNKGLVSLSNFKFVKGTKFIDGIYEVTVKSERELKTHPIQHFIEPAARTIDHRGKYLISNFKKKDFKKQLKVFLKKKNSNTRKFWEELAEKYRTVMVITGQIKDGVLNIFKAGDKDWKLAVKKFESDYKSNYGVFFTEFVKKNEASYERLVKKKFKNSSEVLAGYSHLSELAKEIGSESMNVLANLHKYNLANESEETKLVFQQNNLRNLDGIIKQCKDKIDILSKRN